MDFRSPEDLEELLWGFLRCFAVWGLCVGLLVGLKGAIAPAKIFWRIFEAL